MTSGRFHIGFSGTSRRTYSGISIRSWTHRPVRELTTRRRWRTAGVVLVAGAGVLTAVVVDPVVAGAALVTGVLNTASGGGAICLFLALYASGLPALTAHATSQLLTPASFVGGLRGSPEFWPDRRWMVSGAAGAICGVGILAITPPSLFHTAVVWCLLPAAALVVAQEPIRRLVRSTKRWIGPTATTGLVFVCGVYSGLLGLGTGTVTLAVLGLVPGLLHTPLVPLLRVRNILLTGMAIVVAAAVAVTGLADMTQVAVLALPAAVGGWAGTKIVGRVPAWLLRTAIVATALTATVWILTQP